jgi:hypothetical protein
VDVVDLVWDALMKAVEWPRKPELCEEQVARRPPRARVRS